MNEPNTSAKPSGLSFDPTINAGHLLTFAGFVFIGLGGYTALDKRVVVIEQRTENLDRRAAEQDARLKETLTEIKQDLREVKGTVGQIARNGQKGNP